MASTQPSGGTRIILSIIITFSETLSQRVAFKRVTPSCCVCKKGLNDQRQMKKNEDSADA